jgi:hypothetical protein
MPTAETIAWERETASTQQWPQCAVQQLPENTDLKAEVERAKQIIDLGENWDGEGAEPYLKATLDRAIAFLKMHSD